MDKRFKTISRIASAGVALIGLLGMVGWLFDVPILTTGMPGLTSMTFNTALGFIVTGTALALCGLEPQPRWQSLALQLAGSLILALGVLSLGETLFGWNLGIDQLLHPQAEWSDPYSPPGRLSPGTAFGFALFGVALLVANRRLPGQGLASVVGLVGLLAVLGYSYGAQWFYQMGPYTGMALPTGAGLCLLSLAYLFGQPGRGVMAVVTSETLAGFLARRLLPVAIVVPALLGWLRVLGQESGWYELAFGTGLFALALIVLFTGLVLANTRRMYITEQARHEAQEALRRSETLYHTMARSIPEGAMSVVDRNLRYLTVEGELLPRLGLSKESMAGRTVQEVFEGERGRIRAEHFRRALAGESTSYETEYHERTVWSQFAPLRDEGGQVLAAMSLGFDITERKRAEVELAALRDRLAADLAGMKRLHELSTRFVSQGDLQTLLDAILDAAIAITGGDKGHVQLLDAASGELGIAGQRGFDPAFIEYFNHIRAGVVACGTAMRTRQCVVVEDVTVSPLFLAEPRALELMLAAGMRAVVCIPLLARAGQLGGVLSILFGAPHRPSERDLRLLDLLARQAADFIERSQAESALRQSEERLRLALEAGGMGLWSWDLETHAIQWDKAQYALWGIDPATQPVTPELVRALVLPEELPKLFFTTKGALVAGHQDAEFRIRLPDGQIRWLETYGRVVCDSQGKACKWVGVNFDITERKRAEEALRQAKDELAHANEALERTVQERTASLRETVGELEHFSYSITHDMRAPLRAMRSFAGMLLQECSDCLVPTSRDYLQRIATAAERMDQLVIDALDYSKALRQELPLGPVDPEPLLRGMIESYPALQPPQAHIQIDGPMPKVLANQAGLTQCFSNLLGNAVKFIVPGTVPRVRVWGERREAMVRLWFADNGIGIAPEAQARIFDMFQQVSKEYEGTGIGLALVRKVAERMGGKVGVESEPGRGSRFWLDLKLVDGGEVDG